MAAVPTPWWRLLDLFDRALHPTSGPFPIEEYDEGGTYVVRAELPGLDPDKQVSVVVADDELKIDVDRFPEHVDVARSEFRYGPCSGTVTLPWGARGETATARYDNGVLEVTVEVAKRAPIGRTVPVGGLQVGAVHLAAQYRHLMAEHQNLHILGAANAGELAQHPQDLAQQ